MRGRIVPDQLYDLILSAEKVVDPATFQIRQNAMVCISDDCITRIADNDPTAPTKRRMDFGAAAILPAFVNAHTHLDLSHNRGRMLKSTTFDQWLVKVVESRRDPVESIVAGVREALREMIATGTTRVVDILAAQDYAAVIAREVFDSPVRGTMCVEMFGQDTAQTDAALQRATTIALAVRKTLLNATGESRKQYDRRMGTARRNPAVGYSPHAPYTTSGALYEACLKCAAAEHAPVATHLAESPDERRFIKDGGGDFRDVFLKLGADLSVYRPPGISPLEFWKQHIEPYTITGVNDTLLVHCYDMNDAEIAEMGQRRAVVAYCPRSRAYFGHPPFRFERFAAAGCTISIGTDSLASNDDLNMYHELQQARRENPDIEAPELFRAATMGGRRAIAGRLAGDDELAAWADLQVVSVRGRVASGNLFESLLTREPQVKCVVADGQVVHEDNS